MSGKENMKMEESQTKPTLVSISDEPAGNDNRMWAGEVMKWLARGRNITWGTIELPCADLEERYEVRESLKDLISRAVPGTYVTAEHHPEEVE